MVTMIQSMVSLGTTTVKNVERRRFLMEQRMSYAQTDIQVGFPMLLTIISALHASYCVGATSAFEAFQIHVCIGLIGTMNVMPFYELRAGR